MKEAAPGRVEVGGEELLDGVARYEDPTADPVVVYLPGRRHLVDDILAHPQLERGLPDGETVSPGLLVVHEIHLGGKGG